MKITKSVRLSKESVEKVERIAKQNNDTFSAAIEEIIKNVKLSSEATTITKEDMKKLMREELEESCFKNKEDSSSKSKLSTNFDFDFDDEDNLDTSKLKLPF